MTNMKSIIAGAALFAIATSANAADTTVQASATLVAPITFGTITNMGFGSIVPSAAGGTVVLDTANNRTAVGVTLGNANGAAAASVPVSGDNSATFSVTLSGSVVLKKVGSTTDLTFDQFTLKVGGADEVAYDEPVSGTLSAVGNATLLIGGRLNIPAAADTGAYSTSNGGTPLSVTVNYN